VPEKLETQYIREIDKVKKFEPMDGKDTLRKDRKSKYEKKRLLRTKDTD
jgi:hypothetical protein